MKEDEEEEEEEDRVRRVGRAAEPGASDGWMDGWMKRRRKVTAAKRLSFNIFKKGSKKS